LSKIENATEQKIKTAKQVYWLAGIVAIVLGITTVFLEINRSIDKKTIAECSVQIFEQNIQQEQKQRIRPKMR